MSKLTLSVDQRVIARAKRYAKEHGTSVSQIVEDYLKALSQSGAQQDDPPILRSLRGILKDVDVKDYRAYLAKKYQ
jgi:hypothetical protein